MGVCAVSVAVQGFGKRDCGMSRSGFVAVTLSKPRDVPTFSFLIYIDIQC